MAGKKNSDVKQWRGIYQELVRLIGVEATLILFAEFRGTTISFPLRLERRAAVIKLIQTEAQQGSTVHELSKKYNLAERTIQKYLHEAKQK